MKTTNFLRPILSVIAILFFCTIARAQRVSELTAIQNELQGNIATATARINDANITANMTQAEIAAFQQEINELQARLTLVNSLIAEEQVIANAASQQALRDATPPPVNLTTAVNTPAPQPSSPIMAPGIGSLSHQPTPAKTNVPNRITVEPDPNYPNMIPLFQSTGDPAQDAQIIRSWLANNPYIRR